MTINRRSAKLAQALIVLLALALVFTAVPAVIFSGSQRAYAASANVSTEAQLKAALANASVTDINVTADISVNAGDMDSVGNNLGLDNVARFVVPAGQTKNLNMNGHTVQWYYHADNGDCHLLICEQYSSACDAVYEAGGVHYVLFENNGTLNITGGGTLDTHLAQYNVDSYKQANKQYMAGNIATIKNHGDLTVGAGTNVNISKFAYKVEKYNNRTSSVYAMGAAIYSDAGTVNCAGNITVDMEMQGSPSGFVTNRAGAQTKSLAYGIYARGGVVNATGGNITVNNYAAMNHSNNEPDNSCSIIAISNGIYTASSSSYINNTTIKTYVKYEDDDESNDSGNNCDYSYIDSVGISYTGDAPTVGTGVNIETATQVGNWDSSGSDRVELTIAVTQTKTIPTSLFDVSGNGDFENKSQRLTESTGTYAYKDENGNTWTLAAGDTVMINGTPSSARSTTAKVVVVYRYYDTSNNLEAAFTEPSDYTARSTPIALNGVNAGKVTGGSFTYSSGGAARNSYFYQLTMIRYSSVGQHNANWMTANPQNYILREDSNGNLSKVNNGVVTATAGNIIYVYVDYMVYPVDNVRFNINNAAITSPDNTEATVVYTGKAAQFGSGENQINLHIYKCNITSDRYAQPDEVYANDEEITSRFQTVGSGSTAFSLSVKNADGSSAGTVLPTNPGTYSVTVSTGSESAYNASSNVAKNFGAATFTFTLTIAPRPVTITQTSTPSLTYGQTLSSLTSDALSNYFKVDTGLSGLTATGTFAWQSPSSILNAGSYDDLVLTWTDPKGYFVQQTMEDVKLNVGKAALTVTAKNKTVTYGTELLLTTDDFTFAGLANKAGEDESVFNEIKDTVRVDGLHWSKTGFSAAESHTYQLTATSTANYNITNNSAVLTVNKAGLVITIPNVEKYYDEKDTVDISFTRDAIVSGLEDTYGTAGVYLDTYTQASLANGGAVGETTGSVQIARFTDLLKGPKAGNYTVSTITNASTFVVVVHKAIPTVDALALNASEITYDATKTLSKFSEITGNTNTGEIKVIPGGSGKTAGKWVWKEDVKPTVDTKTYVAQFRPNDSNYDTVDQEMQITVNQRVITVSVTMPDATYGDVQPAGTYVFSGFPEGSTERINVSGSSYTAVNFELSGNVYYTCTYDNNATSAANRKAGTYNIAINNSLTSDNYKFVAAKGCTLTVNKKELTLTPVQKSVIYGDTLQSTDLDCTVTGLVAGDEALQNALALDYSHSYTSSSPVGTYPVTLTVTNASDSRFANYSFTVNPGSIVVAKAVLTVKANDVSVVYGGTPNYTYTVSGFKGADNNSVISGRPTFSSAYSTSSPAGETYQIIVGISGLTADNYSFVVSSETSLLTVTQAAVNVTAWPVYSVENGRTLIDAVVTTDGTASVDGIFRIDDTSVVLSYDPAMAAQTVNAKFYPTNANYKTVTGSVKVTVQPKAISGNLSVTGTIMAGETVRLDVSALDPGVIDNYKTSTVKWFIDDVEKASGSLTFALTEEYIGKDLKVQITADASRGYSGTATYRSPSPISEALRIPTLEDLFLENYNPEQNTKTYTYDKQPHTLQVSQRNPQIGKVTVKYNGAATAVNAGKYTVTVDIASSASGVYAPVTGLVVGYLTIDPRPITVTFSAADKTYDGNVNATISNFDASVGIISTDNVSINRDSATYTFASASAGDGIAVTMNYAFLEGTARDNYVIKQDSIYASILQKEITSVATAADQDYKDGKYTVDAISFSAPAGVLAADKANVSVKKTTGLVGNNAAGTQYVTYIDYTDVLTGSKASNYTFTASNAATLQVKINQVQDPGKTQPTAISVPYSSAQTLATLAGDLPSGWAWDDPTIVPTVRTKTYSATYTPENGSYLTETQLVRVNVTPVEVTITPETAYLTYGDPVPALGYTVIGFTGDDTVASCAGQVIIKTNYTQGSGVSGTYTVSAAESTIANPNYTFKKDITGAIYVSPKTYNVTPVAESREYEPDNNKVVVTFTGEGAINGDNVGLSYASTQGTITNINVGNQLVSFTAPTLTGKSASNYVISVANIGSLRVQITKATPTVNFPTEAYLQYGQKYSVAVFKDDASSAVSGTFALTDANATATEVKDEYLQVRFTPADSGNYNAVTGYVLTRISKAQLDMTVSFSGTLYAGQTLTAIVSGVPADALNHLTYTWYKVNEDGLRTYVGEGRNYELSNDDIGYLIALEVTADPASNYELSETTEDGDTNIYTSVKKVEEESLTFWQKFVRWWYRILAAIQSIFDVTKRR